MTGVDRRSALSIVSCACLAVSAATCVSGPRTGGAIQSAQPSNDKATAAAQPWLSNDAAAQHEQLERHLRGLDLAMIEIGYRFNELYFAGLDRNWPYAQYQVEKIELSMRLALERRPKRAASAKPFMEETIPLVKQAISAASGGDGEAYAAALERLRTDCMKCHVEENVPHFTVYFGKERVSPIRPGDDR